MGLSCVKQAPTANFTFRCIEGLGVFVVLARNDGEGTMDTETVYRGKGGWALARRTERMWNARAGLCQGESETSSIALEEVLHERTRGTL